MNSIYIHIPYCKSVCYYCDFHFSVSLKHKDELINTLIAEIEARKNYFDTEPPVESIYIGGGTPSVLDPPELGRIFDKIYSCFRVSTNAEITIEVNPNDLTKHYLQGIAGLGINRLSIGVQSFFDDDLRWMNRRHNAKEAEASIRLSQDTGFNNLNIDLLYGLPSAGDNHILENLKIFNSMDIPHLSAYHLTIEPKTVFGFQKRKGRLTEIDEEKSVNQYNILIANLRSYGYLHYEISNFCRDSCFSCHNLNYWNRGRYLGIGPSAHSYNGTSRRWNVAVNAQYIKAVKNGEKYFEEEHLTENEHFNDYLLTGLRTIWGIDKRYISENFGEKFLTHLTKEIQKYLNTDLVITDKNKIILSEKGMFLSDRIISELFYV